MASAPSAAAAAASAKKPAKSALKSPLALEPFGDQTLFCEPAWYQGFASRACH